MTFTYRDCERAALSDIDLQVEPSERIVVMGAGGSGKSSLCFAVNGVIPHLLKGDYNGRVIVDEHEVQKSTVGRMARSVGLVMQDYESQLFCPTLELEVAFGPENLQLPQAEIEGRVVRCLNLISLGHRRSFKPAKLSGGQKQLLAIASVMALEPSVLVLDEPTTDLDPVGQQEILAILDSARVGGITCLMTEHRTEAAFTASEIWLIKDGRIIRAGPPQTVLADVELLRACAIRPPGLAELFRTLDLPITTFSAEEAYDQLVRWKPLLQPGRTRSAKLSSLVSSDEIEAASLSHDYKRPDHTALRNVDLRIGAGEFVAIVGENGAGKTTLVKHFVRLLQPSSGEVRLSGRSVDKYSRKELASIIGFVFQNPDHQIFAETVDKEVGFSLRLLGYGPHESRSRVDMALSVVGLENFVQMDPLRLTKGQRQRVAVASALVTKPRILVLDEPTKGLDYPHQTALLEMLKSLHRQGHTIVLVTHSIWIATDYADRVVVMHDGRVLLDGPTRSVLSNVSTLRQARISVPPLVKLADALGLDSMDPKGMAKELMAR